MLKGLHPPTSYTRVPAGKYRHVHSFNHSRLCSALLGEWSFGVQYVLTDLGSVGRQCLSWNSYLRVYSSTAFTRCYYKFCSTGVKTDKRRNETSNYLWLFYGLICCGFYMALDSYERRASWFPPFELAVVIFMVKQLYPAHPGFSFCKVVGVPNIFFVSCITNPPVHCFSN